MKREEYLDLLATRIASIIYATCVLSTSEGNWNVDIRELEPLSFSYDDKAIIYFMKKGYIDDEDFLDLVDEKLCSYEGVLDCERDGTNYDVIIGTAYFDYEDDEEEDEDE